MPLRFRSLGELLAWQAPPIVELIGHGLLRPRSRMIIFGEAGSWKSMLAMDLGLALAQGRPWLGFATSKTSVVLAQVEIPEEDLQVRFRQRLHADGQVPDGFWEVSESELKLESQQLVEFQAALRHCRPGVVILDPLYRLYSGNLAENYQIQPLMDRLDRLSRDLRLAYVVICHTRKLDRLEGNELRDWAQYLFGGVYLRNWVDTAIAVEKLADTTLRLHFVKTRFAREYLPPLDITVSRDTLRFQVALRLEKGGPP